MVAWPLARRERRRQPATADADGQAGLDLQAERRSRPVKRGCRGPAPCARVVGHYPNHAPPRPFGMINEVYGLGGSSYV
jgi:hypothetical protein